MSTLKPNPPKRGTEKLVFYSYLILIGTTVGPYKVQWPKAQTAETIFSEYMGSTYHILEPHQLPQ